MAPRSLALRILAPPYADLSAEEMLIGSLHDLSGGLDIDSKPMANALTLAVEEHNVAGGLLGEKLKLATYDPQSKMQLDAQFAQQAALKDKVAVLMPAPGPCAHSIHRLGTFMAGP